jgi:flagellar protein FliT
VIQGVAGPGPDEALACLAELAATVARMVQLARERRWQALPALDAHCAGLVERLRALDDEDVEATGTSGRAELLALAGRIRADQDELTRLLRPQFLHLARRMAPHLAS